MKRTGPNQRPFFERVKTLAAVFVSRGKPAPQGDTEEDLADDAFAKTLDAIGVGGAGEPGEQGEPGLSAYEVAVTEGFVGTESAWLASLVGSAGADGADGQDGAQGTPGTPGTPGADGEDGAAGQDGADGATGPPGTTSWAGITDKPSTFAPVIGSGAGDAVAGNDSRLTNARTPTSHTHPQSEVTNLTTDLAAKAATTQKLDDFGAPDDNTDLNASSTAHGLLPKLPNVTNKFLRGDGTYATADGLKNQSTADQQINASTTALLTGSTLAVPVDKLRIGTVLRWRIAVTKTNAGTAAVSFLVKLGTAGTTSDATVLTLALPTATGAVDTAFIDIEVTVRGPLSGSGKLQGTLRMTHNLSATGFATIPCVAVTALSGNVDVTVANLIASIACTTPASTVLTFVQVNAEASNL